MRGNVENKNNNPINIRFVDKISDIRYLSETPHLIRHTILLCFKNGTLEKNKPIWFIPYLEHVTILDYYT